MYSQKIYGQNAYTKSLRLFYIKHILEMGRFCEIPYDHYEMFPRSLLTASIQV